MAEKRCDRAALWRDAATARKRPQRISSRKARSGSRSWAEAAERVENYANGLLLGLRKGDAFAIIGSNRVEWALFDFALGSIRAIGAAIYANSSPSDAGYILEHSEAIGVLCEDEAQRAKVESVRGTAPPQASSPTPTSTTSPPAGARNRAPERAPRGRGAGRGGRLFTYIYTSGTTGPPKRA